MKLRFKDPSLKNYLIYLVVGLVGIWFLTRFWLPEGFIIAGHDSGLALDTRQFLATRFFAWDQQGFGQDNSMHFGSLILHSIDYLMSLFAGVPYAGNQLTFFFWLALIFLAAFIFSYKLKDKLGRFFPFIFPPMISFNFLILQSVFILERAKYSILIASLLILAIMFALRERKISLVLGAVLSSLILFIFNSGSWLGLPLYGSLIVIILTLVLFELIVGVRNRDFRNFGRLLVYLILTAGGFLILNSYSILPYLATFLKQDYLTLLDAGVVSQNRAWLESLSSATSFLNIFRLQGVPDWYSGANAVNIVHSYADYYLSNPYLITLSFVFPVLAFWSFVLAKTDDQKRLISFFGLLVLISMFFVAGSHKPLGFLYKFLYNHVPGFSIFRSPYFKFGSAFFLAMSALMAFTLSWIIESVSKRLAKSPRRFLVGVFLSIVVITAWLGFHNVLFDSDKLFSWQKGLTTRLKVPEYIEDFKKWSLEENKVDKRILLLPPFNENWRNDSYNWGYWSLTSLPSVLTPKTFLTNDHALTGQERGWINALYGAIKEGDEEKVFSLSKRLGVGFFLIRKDVVADLSWSATDSPEIYEDILDSLNGIDKVKNFGEWALYEVKGIAIVPNISAISSVILIPGRHSYLAREFLKDERVVFKEADIVKERQTEPVYSKEIEAYTCQSCSLERRGALEILPEVKIFPNSFLYYFKILREKSTLEQATTEQTRADAYLGFSLRRTAEVRTMLDFGINERYITENLQMINFYLENLYQILQSSSDPNLDFYRARILLDSINPVEKSLREYVRRQDFDRKSGKFQKEMINVLWNVYKLKSFYAPLYGDVNILRRDKVYFIGFPEKSSYELFLNIESLPVDRDGKAVLPSIISFQAQTSSTVGEEKATLSVREERDGWLEIQLPPQLAEEVILTLQFDSLPNLFTIDDNSFEQSLVGTRACYFGKIKSFANTKKYYVEVNTTKKDQALRIFFLETEQTKSKNNFLHGEDEVDVDPILGYEPFRYMYYPTALAEDPTIYLCSDNKELPVIDSMEIYEIFSPLLITEREMSQNGQDLPKVTFKQINSTKYEVSVEEATSPFILLFNSRYNPFWKLYELDGKQKIENQNHFMVDGYANAWKISETGNFSLTLEYSPQRLFLRGSAVSLIGLVVFGGYAFYIFVKKSRKS
jgi:hypothetical protein